MHNNPGTTMPNCERTPMQYSQWTGKLKHNLILPPTRKTAAFVVFAVESLSNLGKSMSKTKLSGKIGFEIFPDFEVPWKNLKIKLNKLNLPTFLIFWHFLKH